MTNCLISANANLGGYFKTSVAADRLMDEAHAAAATFLGAKSAREIIFGQNSTSLTLHISRSIARTLSAGDEIVLSRMDHDCNVAPWLMIAKDTGATVRWLELDTDDFTLQTDSLETVISEKTKLVAVGYSSNVLGTINDVKAITQHAHSVGALVFIDAVQLAPHRLIDVQDLGCDFLICSPYKFYGPHQGILWGKEELLRDLIAYRVRPAGEALPSKFETGTLSHESIAGTHAAIDHIANLSGLDSVSSSLRDRLIAGFAVMEEYENAMTLHLINELQETEGVTVLGITNPNRIAERVPTVSFVANSMTPQDIAKQLADKNIFVWSGHNYGIEPYRALSREDEGGVRVGLAHYNTVAEIDDFIKALRDLLDQPNKN
ncbi:cysteine desulfurase-like protein [Kordiimonas sediminis]|uniref:Cysteine desulfurase-like protein n=2 Tax=Kordiimonas sediminis TaxID=1735581 RepID=A0A919EAA3_9PROT|nr:cysteine desulfurase-like protein [Kordiimonas sediminis]